MGGILSGIDGAEDRESSPVLKDTIRELAR
jgi:hypothetical protein